MSLRRTGLKLCLLAACLLAGRTNPPAATATVPTASTIAASTYYPEVRLRKVHLVRPDLIFYPLDYEIFC